MTTIRPLFDRVLVKRNTEPTQTKSGLFLPDTASKEKPVEGKVVAAGNGRVDKGGNVRPLDVKKGDRVLFGKYSGTEVQLEGKELLIMREEDILAVIEGK